MSLGVGVFCKASMVADVGELSPSIAFGGGRVVGRKVGVSLLQSRMPGVGVPDLVGLLSGDRLSSKIDARDALSGDRSGDLVLSR